MEKNYEILITFFSKTYHQTLPNIAITEIILFS